MENVVPHNSFDAVLKENMSHLFVITYRNLYRYLTERDSFIVCKNIDLFRFYRRTSDADELH